MARRRTTAEPSGFTILVVDDKEEVLTSTKLLLEREGHRVLTTASGEEALALFHHHQVHLVIVDYFMPRMNGEELVQAIRTLDADVEILLQTGYSGERPPREMLRALDIQGYHDKSEGPERLLLWVDVALKAATRLKQVKETEQLKSRLLLKEEFLANASHEMRTPLNVILGYSEMLLGDESEPLPPHVRQALESMQKQGRTLCFLTDNFLGLAKMEAEAMGVALEGVVVSALQEEMQELMGILLRGKPVSFVWQVSPQLPPVWADPQKLLLILRNLLSNAAKFTERGEVHVLASLTSCGEVALTVQDTGIGIAPEHHEVIFELFRQIDGSSTRRFGGTGIGLALARKLVRMMDGEITVESALGAGATFTLTLKTPPGFSLPSPASSPCREEKGSPCLSASE